jgi:hypothetical protein
MIQHAVLRHRRKLKYDTIRLTEGGQHNPTSIRSQYQTSNVNKLHAGAFATTAAGSTSICMEPNNKLGDDIASTFTTSRCTKISTQRQHSIVSTHAAGDATSTNANGKYNPVRLHLAEENGATHTETKESQN